MIGHNKRGRKVSNKTKRKLSLKQKGKYLGKNNPNWKGGYFTNDIPLYNNFFKRLSFIDECRRNKNDKQVLEVKCSYCNKWFIPKIGAVYHRLLCLENIGGESRFYCSDDCKNKCEIYSTHAIDFINKKDDNIEIYTDQEYKVFREFVLKRDNYKCQYCEKEATDVHHERPKKLEPFFALDPDFAWSCCKECHREKGHRTGSMCDINELRNIECSNKGRMK